MNKVGNQMGLLPSTVTSWVSKNVTNKLLIPELFLGVEECSRTQSWSILGREVQLW